MRPRWFTATAGSTTASLSPVGRVNASPFSTDSESTLPSVAAITISPLPMVNERPDKVGLVRSLSIANVVLRSISSRRFAASAKGTTSEGKNDTGGKVSPTTAGTE